MLFLKKMNGWNSKPEILHEGKTHESEKKVSIFFTIPALHGENAIRKLTYIFLLFFPSFTKDI